MLSPMVMSALEGAPRAFFHVIDDVRPERYHDRLETDRFDLAEMVAHVADLEDLFLDRLRLALERPGDECVVIDPDTRAKEKDYASRDLHHELAVYQNRRNDTLDFLRNLAPGDDAKTVRHPVYGELSIHQLAINLLAHDMYHIEQAAQYLR